MSMCVHVNEITKKKRKEKGINTKKENPHPTQKYY